VKQANNAARTYIKILIDKAFHTLYTLQSYYSGGRFQGRGMV
jgi:hypothetical protein